MLHQISIYLTLSLNKFYQKSARKSTASGITHEKPSDVVILSAPREEERGSDDQCERFGHGDGEPDAVDAEKFWQKKLRRCFRIIKRNPPLSLPLKRQRKKMTS